VMIFIMMKWFSHLVIENSAVLSGGEFVFRN
jgi:hypothetical protein